MADQEQPQKPQMTEEEAEEIFAKALDSGEVQIVYGDVEGGALDSEEETDDGGEGDEELDQDQEPLKDVADDSVLQFRGHSDAVHSVAVSQIPVQRPGRFLAASGGQDESTQLFDLRSGEPLGELPEHKDTIIEVQFHPSGEFLATASMDGTVQVYRVRQIDEAALEEGEGKEDERPAVELLHTLEGPSAELEWLSWHSSGSIIAAGGADSTVWMWNAKTGQMMRVFQGHGGSVLCGSFAGVGGKVLATGGEDARMFIWSPKTGQAAHIVSGHRFHEAPITALEAQADGALILTGSEDTTVCVTHADSGKVLQQLKGHQGSVEAVSFCPANKNFALSASVDCTVRLWDITQGTCRSVLQHPEDAVVCAQFLPGSVLLVSAGAEGILRLWDGRNGKLVRQWTGPQGPVNGMAVSADGKTVLLASDDHTVRVFDLTKKPQAELLLEQQAASAAAEEKQASAEGESGEPQAAKEE